MILASLLPDGQDPLSVLDIQANTLGILHILCVVSLSRLLTSVVMHGRVARMHTTGAPILPLEYVIEFCRTFVPEQARYAPERGEPSR